MIDFTDMTASSSDLYSELPSWLIPASSPSVSSLPVGARLQAFSPNWSQITTDPWVLSTVTAGLRWSFSSPVPLTRHPISLPASEHKCPPGTYAAVIAKDLAEGIIEEVPMEGISPGFYSRFFLVEKRGLDADGNRRWRSVLDLSVLNKLINVPRFRMETPETIRAALRKGDYATSIDLSDAYHHIPVHPLFRRYLRFMFDGKVYQFIAMPAGLAVAPWAFTRVLFPIRVFAHSRGIILHQYLDDWLVRSLFSRCCSAHTSLIIDVAEALGFIIHLRKSDLVPTQRFVFLGYLWDTAEERIYPPPNRWEVLGPLLETFRTAKELSARMWLRLLGCCVALTKIVPLAMCYLRPMQLHLAGLWKMSTGSLVDMLPVTPDFVQLLKWWTVEHLNVGVPFRLPDPSITLYTDASAQGWGAHLGDVMRSGTWPADQADLHINIKELLAVEYAVKEFRDFLKHKAVLIASDNTTVLSYINKEGGTHTPELCVIAVRLCIWCYHQDIRLRAIHVPGKVNLLADALSRPALRHALEWSLHADVFRAITRTLGIPQVDLFASKDNRKCEQYCSFFPEPEAMATNSLLISWEGMFGYAYPPVALIPPVLRKVRTDSCSLVLIAPCWPAQAWFPELLHLLAADPVRLPDMDRLLYSRSLRRFRGNDLHLHAWLLTADVTRRSHYLALLSQRDLDPSGAQLGFVAQYPVYAVALDCS